VLRSNEGMTVGDVVATPEWARWPVYVVHPIVLLPTPGRVSLATTLVNESDVTSEARHVISLTLQDDTWATHMLEQRPMPQKVCDAAETRVG
jgi:hypothetical protein